MVAHDQLVRCGGLARHHAPLLDLRRLGVSVLDRDRGARDRTIRAAHALQQLAEIDVAHHDHGGTVGCVVRPVELATVVGGEPEDVLHEADGRPTVAVLAERLGIEQLDNGRVHVVVDGLAALVGHHLALASYLRLVEHQAVHAVGLQPDHQLQRVAGQLHHVVGPVEVGGSVALGAGVLEHSIELAEREALGLAEHQVLEQMRDAGFAQPLVPGADVEPGLVANDRCAVVDEHEQPEPVVEPESLDRHVGAEAMAADVLVAGAHADESLVIHAPCASGARCPRGALAPRGARGSVTLSSSVSSMMTSPWAASDPRGSVGRAAGAHSV